MSTGITTDDTAKCPCCNNPWASGAFLAAMTATACETCNATINSSGIHRDNFDTTVAPHDNFYMYANGGWMQKNPIPKGYPNWNTFVMLHVQSQERCKELLDELLLQNTDTDTDSLHTKQQDKIARFYATAMNEDAIEAAGVAPMKEIFTLIQAIVVAKDAAEPSEYARLLGQLDANYGISPFFSVGVSPDAKDSNHSICQIYQGGLGLPDRDYYFDEDKQDKRDAYVKHIATLLKLSNAESDDDNCSTMAKQIFDLETTLANSHMTKTECRDPEATYNKMTVAEITRRTDNNFDFASYFMGSTNKTTTDLGDVNVRNVDALTCAARVMSTLDVKVLEGYLQWTALSSCAPYLSRAFVDAQFEFFEKTLSGTDEIKPRWKRAMAFTETALGEILGELYCAKYFDEECKTRALAIVDQVRNALEQRLTTVDWMKSDLTRQEALKKMSNFKVKIGYPNKWIDYSALTFVKDEPFLSLVLKSRAFHHGRVVAEMNAPTDRDMWFMTPQTVNAYYHPSLNEIVFPAAILQHPFFDKNADDAVNFGAMGCVVGHEMTHGFDDKGRKFDAQGVLHDWWTADDAAEYEKRVNVMVEQANSFHVHGKAVQGKLTSGENIADLGGLRLALAALRATKDYDETNLIDGFTPVQRFFLSWAQCWRQNIGKERSLQLLTIDPHGPNEMRCNGPLSNLTDFYTAFNIPESSSMFKPAESRVDIW